MDESIEILNEIAEKTGGNILHGGEITVRLISAETLKKYYDGRSLCMGTYSLSVLGKNQEDVLNKTAAAIDAASRIDSVFCFKLCGSEGEYTSEGNYRYTVKFSCKYTASEANMS